MARVLGRIRLSRITEATTSPERQREAIEQWAAANGHEMIGWAEDRDVSRSVDPLEAPELGPWLNEPERAETWDILACWKLDRVATGSIYLNKVMGWCFERGKALVSVTESFDLSTWIGRTVANVIAGVAEGEWEAISARNYDAWQHNYKRGKWTGGVPPLGYRPEKIEGQWQYVLDPVMAPRAREIVDRVLKGESVRAIRLNLNERGIPSPRDYFRTLQGKEPTGQEWHTNAIKRALQSPAMMGQAVYREPIRDANGNPVKKNGKKQHGPEQVLRDDSGKPVVRSEPLIDRRTFDRLQEKLSDRSKPPKRRKNPTPLLLQVIFCAVCERPMYRQRGRHFDYYRCSSAQYRETCGNRSVSFEQANELVTESLLDTLGDLERHRKVWDPGEDHAHELSEIDSELTDLTGLIGSPAYRKGTPQRERLDERISRLAQRQDELNALPFRPSGYRYEPTGQKFRDFWGTLDADERNMYLRSMSVRLEARRLDGQAQEWSIDFGDLRGMLQAVDPSVDPDEFVRQREELAAENRRAFGVPL